MVMPLQEQATLKKRKNATAKNHRKKPLWPLNSLFPFVEQEKNVTIIEK